MHSIRVSIIRVKRPAKTAEAESGKTGKFQAEIGNICLTGVISEIKRAAQPSEVSRLCSSDLYNFFISKKKIMRLSVLPYEDSSVLWKASV